MGFFGGGGGGTTPVNMVGASSGTAGTAGYVPAPAAGDQASLLAGDATFSNLPSVQRAFLNTSQEALPLMSYRNGTGGVGPSSGQLYLNHVFCPAATYTKLGVYVGFGSASAANTTYRVGVYDCDQATLAPVNRIYQSAETNFFSLSTSILVSSLSIAITKAGWYCVAFIMANRGSWTARGLGTSPYIFITSRTSDTGADISGMYVTHTGTSDNLPTSITASNILFTNASINSYLQKT